MSQLNIFFYSNNCRGSQLLISQFNNEKITQFFLMFCVDDNPKTPPQIKYTPTLLLKGVPTLYEGKDAFIWLARIKEYKQHMIMKKLSLEQRKYLEKTNKNLSNDDQDHILGFNEMEMGAMSDMFSFFDSNIELEQQDAMPQTYVNYQSLGDEYILTPPKENTKMNSIQQKKKFQDLMFERRNQENDIKQGMREFMGQK